LIIFPGIFPQEESALGLHGYGAKKKSYPFLAMPNIIFVPGKNAFKIEKGYRSSLNNSVGSMLITPA
jgi:hypothetical protein